MGLPLQSLMRHQLLALSLAISASLFGSQDTASPAIQPSLKLDLVIEGKSYEATTSATVIADIHGKKIAILIKERPTKTFHYSGVLFEFQKDHVYEFQALDNIDMWTLSGNNNKIMAFLPKAESKTVMDNMIKTLIQKYGKNNTKISKCEQEFGGTKVIGQRLLVNLAEVKLLQEVYLITNANHEIIILLQDTLQDDGNETAETSGVRKLLELTFSFKE